MDEVSVVEDPQQLVRLRSLPHAEALPAFTVSEPVKDQLPKRLQAQRLHRRCPGVHSRNSIVSPAILGAVSSLPNDFPNPAVRSPVARPVTLTEEGGETYLQVHRGEKHLDIFGIAVVAGLHGDAGVTAQHAARCQAVDDLQEAIQDELLFGGECARQRLERQWVRQIEHVQQLSPPVHEAVGVGR